MRDSDLVAVNVRSSRYWIARVSHRCLHCAGATSAAALVLPPAHETSSFIEDPASSAEADRWEHAPRCAVLFHIGRLPAEVARRLTAVAPGYRLAVGDGIRGRHWANHCERCDCLQEDDALFCEPEGAFFPISSAGARQIELVEVVEEIEAFAAGYIFDPPFFEFAVRK